MTFFIADTGVIYGFTIFTGRETFEADDIYGKARITFILRNEL